MKNLRSLFVAGFCLFGAGCPIQSGAACKIVGINSAGSYSFPAVLLLEIAPGSGGIGKTANYVLLSPKDFKQKYEAEITKILLMAKFTDTSPQCRHEAAGGSTVICKVAVPNTSLIAVISYEEKGGASELTRYRADSLEIAANISRKITSCGKNDGAPR